MPAKRHTHFSHSRKSTSEGKPIHRKASKERTVSRLPGYFQGSPLAHAFNRIRIAYKHAIGVHVHLVNLLGCVHAGACGPIPRTPQQICHRKDAYLLTRAGQFQGRHSKHCHRARHRTAQHGGGEAQATAAAGCIDAPVPCTTVCQPLLYFVCLGHEGII
eukprot:1148039-Pelagomonas_calceolata.AAC.2